MAVLLITESVDYKVAHDTFTIDLTYRGARVRDTIGLRREQTVEFIPSEGPRYVLPTRVAWVGTPGSAQDGQAGLEFLRSIPW